MVIRYAMDCSGAAKGGSAITRTTDADKTEAPALPEQSNILLADDDRRVRVSIAPARRERKKVRELAEEPLSSSERMNRLAAAIERKDR